MGACLQAAMVTLDETGVHNLGIQTALAEEASFEETMFALGNIESIPARTARISSRIAGRLIELNIAEGDTVTAESVVAKVESRQPGNTPPAIPLITPLSGLVTRSSLRWGDPVDPGTSIAEITDLSEVYAVARIPETHAAALSTHTRARITIPALANQQYEGTLLRLGTTVDVNNGTIEAIFRLDNTTLRMRPGMRAEFQIILRETEKVLLVPTQAIQGLPSSRHVYVTDFSLPNTFIKAPVQTGRSNREKTEILKGIFPGDEVVTRGSYSLGFVGDESNVSLKETLDAAHGHAHNPDGSEMTPEQQAAHQNAGATDNHGHEHAETSLRELFFILATIILALLLVWQSVRNRNHSETTR